MDERIEVLRRKAAAEPWNVEAQARLIAAERRAGNDQQLWMLRLKAAVPLAMPIAQVAFTREAWERHLRRQEALRAIRRQPGATPEALPEALEGRDRGTWRMLSTLEGLADVQGGDMVRVEEDGHVYIYDQRAQAWEPVRQYAPVTPRVVRAPSEEQARILADGASGIVWKSTARSSCELLLVQGEPGVVLSGPVFLRGHA